jgi:hypothetical protein
MAAKQTAAQKKAEEAAAKAEVEKAEAEAAAKAAEEAKAEAEAAAKESATSCEFKNPTEHVIRVIAGDKIAVFQPGEQRELPLVMEDACVKALLSKV